ncbi:MULTISPECIES: YciE/YciF ferroxidase family protein [Salegentibacter]|uniref:Ferritin-like metal-binding protein YciE n=2 Tax=Salegentibacter TaxID=143222 RepID=A0A1T5DV09_9FLAO|nr:MULTISPECIES: ferritin-like domain-containing protein [Salegentibacter]PRX48007.1 ferritin-like metal-binding protein YciE [Salegentibacter salegens]SHM37611.1 Ferritin-like metal-binding protein YciE [Salegentibacter salegens]SKB75233.1 Ferritin-like metal-binding protein YciE [Salegentibacter holothuriorum]
MKKLEDLFEHQLKDLYSAESQLVKALPKMAKAATDEKLKKAFEDHLEETKEHKKRLEEVSKELGFKPTGEECKAMKGLIEEAEAFLKEDAEDDVRDAGIIADAQRVEHYEISGYGTLVRYAKELGHKAVANKLQKTLDEEYTADEDLNKLAEKRVNKKAK